MFYRVLPGFQRYLEIFYVRGTYSTEYFLLFRVLYRVLLGFIGFYWVQLGFTGFYWVFKVVIFLQIYFFALIPHD